MLNEFVLYSFLLGALAQVVVWAISKDSAIGGIASFALGIIFVLFVFPEPESAKDLAGVADNLTLIIIKVLWGLGWLAGLVSAFWCTKKLKP
ncbi:hypothetical protein [Pseudoalteromonas sp. DY56-GL79]|uniref:hypothetical protein n=1 Tax=Pseudoalteromonas sp. DY56-GL79 TaxID=2967131 RepID=UPI00352A4776